MKPIIRIIIIYATFILLTILLAVLWQQTGLPVELGVAQMGPFLGALILGYLVFKDAGKIKTFLVEGEHPLPLVILVAGIPFILAIIAKTIHGFFPDTSATISMLDGTSLFLILLWVPLGAFFEEIGWRNYLGKYINKVFETPIYGYIVLGLLWSAWHMQNYQYGFVFVFGQVLLLTSLSVLIGDITKRYGQNILSATLMHVSINLGVIYLMYTGTFTAYTSLIYGAITALFVVYYYTNEKKVDKR